MGPHGSTKVHPISFATVVRNAIVGPMNKLIEIVAKEAYTAYCVAVGGRAFNGDPLPDWNTFKSDPKKQPQVIGWKAAAHRAVQVLEHGHQFWGAGEPDCPADIKAPNGELHTLQCKLCGAKSPKSPVCLAGME